MKSPSFLSAHEKFISFVLLGAALFAIAVMVYMKPPANTLSQSGAGLAILNTIVGALTLAFGGAANALFKISTADKQEIGRAASDAIQNGPPVQTEVVNTDSKPVPVDTGSKDSKEELPDYAR